MVSEFQNLLMSCVLLDEEASQSETLALSARDSSETSQSKTENTLTFSRVLSVDISHYNASFVNNS